MNRRSILLGLAVTLLAAQALSSVLLTREPFLPSPPPFSTFPLQLGAWTGIQEEALDSKTLSALGPDDYLVRLYRSPGEPNQAELFIAYYKSQLRAKEAHDPKVCLPGAGWNPTDSRIVTISNPNGRPFAANYYRIKRDDEEEVVVYWFQTFSGAYTQEQQLKAHRIWDAIVENRTDMALVRVVVPITASGPEKADANATELAKAAYNTMLPYFPPTEKSGS